MTGVSARTRVVVAVGGARGDDLAVELRAAGADVRLVVDADAPASAVIDAVPEVDLPGVIELRGELTRLDVLVTTGDRGALTPQLVSACDRFGVRIVALCEGAAQRRVAEAFGVVACGLDATADELLAPAWNDAPAAPATRGRVIAVWGAAGAPGRTTMAIELACELARDGRRVALVDADAHAPSLAMATGLADEGPGFAAACRQAERGTLTTAELTRIAVRLGPVDVLTGINRPSRWPELGQARVASALERCRDWADDIVVDVAAPLERDEEIVSDLEGPRRNAATLAALASADLVVAVVAADPVGVSRFVRAHPDLRAVIGATPVRILVNKTRTSTLGLDARGQVRRTLERYAGARDMWFAPWDAKAADAATLAAQPVAHVAGRSPLAAAIRRFVGEAIEPPAPARSAQRETARVRRAGVRRARTA
ncbi:MULTISPECIES: P-loop NTPase [unclassified Microbacterium]|uniref:P-loop NTPase n=1 Tax=unclassified Microbacterium TaxID=2609290 RepID=UPI000A877FBB|nr:MULTISPECIES: P-loop NTPase [unclassified Microbacterium]